ncbi:MAG TPA: hypothetical protein VKK31_28040 [Thermoanaerobaculia bacterium]|nr:hypothetical protein [Thermoanaerobaculia bacterium]
MPKLSYDQQIARLEGTLALVRSNAGSFPPLALAVADDLERTIAEIKATKVRQQALFSAQMAKTDELASVVRRGTLAARELSSYVVLALGTKDARLSTFGIRVRGRRRRKVQSRSGNASEPLADGGQPLEDALEASGDAGRLSATSSETLGESPGAKPDNAGPSEDSRQP